MDHDRFDDIARALAAGASRRQVVQWLCGGVTAAFVSLVKRQSVAAQDSPPIQPREGSGDAVAAATARDPEPTRVPDPSEYCWNTAGTKQGPNQPPTPFLYQPFRFVEKASAEKEETFGWIWSSQMDHTRPTYGRDGTMHTLGERLAYTDEPKNDPTTPYTGGTKALLPNGKHANYDRTVSPSTIEQQTGATIFAYESAAFREMSALDDGFLFYDGHDGHDFAIGGDALAAAAGTVTFAGNSQTPLGRVVEIFHPEGYLTRYAHLADFADGVEEGEPVEVGQPVGTIGGSAHVGGTLTDDYWGIHLHFSVFRWNAGVGDWQVTDPFGWDPWQSPGEQDADPLVRCNGEVSHNLWFGWWPGQYGVSGNTLGAATPPVAGRYLGGLLADPSLTSLPTGGFSTPEEAAGVALAALANEDLVALGRAYIPGTAPSAWTDVWSRDTGPGPDFTGCSGVSYSLGSWTTEGACRPTEHSTDVEVIAFFDLPGCGQLTAGEAAPRIHSVIVRTQRLPDGWYVAALVGLNGNAPEFGQPCVDAPLPSEFAGAWEGTGTQTDPPMDWPILITLTDGGAGEIVGTVAYPSLGCTGETSLRGVDASTVKVTEAITAAQGICVDGGTFFLSLADDGSLTFRWSSPDRTSTATGSLTRNSGGVSGDGLLVIWMAACPSVTETGFEFIAQPWNVDPGPTCRGVDGEVNVTIADASGGIIATGITSATNFDLPFGTYSVTETMSGASATFELTADDSDFPDGTMCAGYDGCMVVIVSIPYETGREVCVSEGRPCASDADCCQGEFCLYLGYCTTICASHSDCPNGSICCTNRSPA